MAVEVKSQPAVEPRPRRFTVAEYDAMVAADVLREDDRVELLDGEILCMNPIGPTHAGTVRYLDRLFNRQVGGPGDCLHAMPGGAVR